MNRVKPTRLQKATLEILKENPNKRISQAMVEAGYSAKSAEKPKQNFTDRVGTIVAMEKYRKDLRGKGLDEDRVINKLNEMIDAVMIKTSLTEPDRVVPDYKTQIEAVKMLRDDLGVKGKEDDSGVNLTQNNFYANLTDEQLDALIDSKLRKAGIVANTSGEGEKTSA